MRPLWGRAPRFADLAPEAAVDLAYQVMLRRSPDPGGRDNSLALLRSGLTNQELVDSLRASSEYHRDVRYPGKLLGHSLHASRCQFVRSLPPGRVIVDLGGTDLGNPAGAMVAMGYPYRFDSLTIIDLPSEDRHEIYRQDATTSESVDTPLGPVTYRYHSMTDLSGIPDDSVDLVYSGQSIEHVPPEAGRHVLAEVARILRPGGHLGLDTPNGTVTRLQQDEFVDPDHEVEYRLDELRDLIEGSGLAVVDCKGANYSGRGLAAGRFDVDEVAANSGLYWDAAACYLLCVVATKP
ncbi:MAG: class I SAM-dependent methyltransferase [Acidobacteriota bacterium]|nr:class I SAM-dependent methyltransferase [Acidobacteriota bacterium]